MQEIGLSVPASGIAHTLDEAHEVVARDRPARRHPARRTSSAARAPASPRRRGSSSSMAANGLAASPISEILIEQSIAGWKEYELEVMRDRADNCVIVCSIENLDPMGVHTGDSITVAPAQTLTDVEYQRMRDAAFACIRRVGVETGGSNVQFALDPTNGEMVIIEMNPRVSRARRAGVEGHRLPDRQDRRQARRRLHARRDPQRHHPQDAGQLRAGHRLRRHQGAALGLREVPRHGRRARHVDAVGRRGDGDRPHVPRVAAEGAALARARPGRPQLRPGRGGARRADRRRARRAGRRSPRPTGPFQLEAALRRGISHRAGRRARPRSTRGSSTRSPRSSTSAPTSPSVGFAGMDRRTWRRAKRLGFSDAQLAWLWGVPEDDGARRPARRRRRGHVQDRRHLRVRVRGRDAVPLLDLRGRGRGASVGPRARSSSSAPARTASARASSSTTAACTPPSPCATPASRR